MPDEETNNQTDNERIQRIRERLARAERKREPKFVTGRMGTRMISLDALREQILQRFVEEHSSDSPTLLNASTKTKRLSLILAKTDYVLAVESIQLTPEQKADLMRRVYADLFSFGPLDALLQDMSITTISLKGADSVSVRYGNSDLVPLDTPIFETEAHLRQIMNRIAQTAHVQLDDDIPIIEFGLSTEQGRPMRVSIAGTPVTYEMTVDIRLHPAEALSLRQFVEAGVMSQTAAQLLNAIVESPHGMVIVGDIESGKTSLLSALVQMLPQQSAIAVERAGELRLPEHITSLCAQWASAEQEALSFGQRIGQALEKSPDTLILDEVRADEAAAIAPILLHDNAPRQIWAFRGPANSKRLSAALGMFARRSDPTAGETIVQNLYRKLPFVIVMRRIRGTLTLHTIAEWQFTGCSDYPDFVELCVHEGGKTVFTGKSALKPINVSEDLWTST